MTTLRPLTLSLLILLLSIGHTALFAQNKTTFSGYVEDEANGERLIGAAVSDSLGQFGTVTNSYGYFSLSITEGVRELRVSYIGYQAKILAIGSNADSIILVKLSAKNLLQTVEIKGQKQNRIEERTQMSQVTIPIEQIKRMPMILGEADVLKALQFLPGVKGGTEGSAGILVRGGSQDQNLVLLDGVPVYNSTHIGGLFSVFNADAVKNVTLTKGGFPARFGGRLSSILEVDTKDGNKKEFHTEATIGLLLSKLTLEGPIFKDKLSYMISARRTYLDLILSNLINENNPSFDGESQTTRKIYFYDINAKLNYRINNSQGIYLSIYNGSDKFGVSESNIRRTYTSLNNNGFDFQNNTASIRWNWAINQQFFLNATVYSSRYNFNFEDGTASKTQFGRGDTTSFNFKSSVEDLAAKLDFNYSLNNHHQFKFGASLNKYNFVPSRSFFSSNNFSFDNGGKDTVIGGKNIEALGSDVYLEDEIHYGRFRANLGVHYSYFKTDLGFSSVQPRVSLSYLFKNGMAIKGAYSTMAQFLHLLVNDALGVPTDSWVPSKKGVAPAESNQIALGIAKTMFEDYELSVEVYQKNLKNLTGYKEGSGFLSVEPDWEEKVTQGQGTSKGFEVLIQKKEGRLTGWLSYTLSKTDRQFDDVNNGKPFPFRYDRTHEFSVVASYKLNNKITFSANWSIATGNAITLPSSIYKSVIIKQTFDGDQYDLTTFVDYSSRNEFRTKTIHRLDVGVEFFKKRRLFERRWNVGFYNAYNRANPFYFSYSQSTTFSDKGRQLDTLNVRQNSLFPILPYVSFSIKF